MIYALPPPRLLILIGGVSGVGKSHTAQALARTLNAYLLSTDVLRAAMRSVVPAQVAPHLHRSSFMACSESTDMLTTVDHQTRALTPALHAAVERALSEHPIVVAEGVHLLPDLDTNVPATSILQVLLTVPNPTVHQARLQERSRETSGRRSAQLPILHMGALRDMQDALIARAIRSNTNVLPADDLTHSVLCLLAFDRLSQTSGHGDEASFATSEKAERLPAEAHP
jgi:2-phosphoglycerate kinase